MKDLLTPLKLLELTYGDTPVEFYEGMPVLHQEINNVSKRWQKFVEENYIPKPKDVDDNDEDIRM